MWVCLCIFVISFVHENIYFLNNLLTLWVGQLSIYNQFVWPTSSCPPLVVYPCATLNLTPPIMAKNHISTFIMPFTDMPIP